jgi:DNA-binding IclR family transcriptional regulator
MSSNTNSPVLVALFGDTPFLRILDTLLTNPDHEYTKQELAEENDLSRQTVYRIWDRVEKLELVEYTRQIGSAQLFQLNKDSPLVQQLLQFRNELQEDNSTSLPP